MKRKELFLMLIPCLILAGIGAYFTRKPAPVFPAKLNLVVETKLVPVAPRDVARGFDTAVLIQTKLTGPKTIDFTDNTVFSFPLQEETSITDAQGKRLDVPVVGDYSTEDKTPYSLSYQVTYLMKLGDAPPKTGDLFLHLALNRMIYQNSTGRQIGSTKNLPSDLLVRGAGEKIRVPTVKKYRPFKLLGLESGPKPWIMGSNYDLTFYIDRFEPLQHLPGRGQIGLDKSQIIADGKIIPTNSGHSWNADRNPLGITKHLTIPPKCRNAKFKGLLSINDCWPLPIEIELRKNGKNIVRPMPKLPEMKSTP